MALLSTPALRSPAQIVGDPLAKRRRRIAWSKDDVRTLSALAKAPVSGPQIAKKLKRTPGRFRRRRLHWGFVFAAELLTP